MKSLLTAFLFGISLQSYSATLNMKPGIWETKITITRDGKTINPMAEMEKALEKMPKAQREQMLAQLSKQLSKDNINQTCITKEMIADPQKMKIDKNDRCTQKVNQMTADKIDMSFTCKDGSHGKSVLTMISAKEYKMASTMTDADGKKSTMDYHGKHIRDNCRP